MRHGGSHIYARAASREPASIARRTAPQVRLDQELRPAAEAHAIDLQVFQYPLDVVARLGERYALDPIDWINLGVPRIAVLGNPLLYPSTARVVAGEGEDVGAAVLRDQLAELGRT